jgi:hypothetical protein
VSEQFRKVDEVVLHGGYIFDLVRADFLSSLLMTMAA